MDKEIIWLIRGSQRKEVFLNLPSTHFTANKFRKELIESKKINISLREMSRHLKDFESRELVSCLNKSDPYNKLYHLTEKGLKTHKKLTKLNL